MSWATDAETLAYTGIAVTETELSQAQAIIEMYAGTTELASDAGNISSTNLRLLKLAVAYQAAWLTGQSGTYTNMGVDEMAEGSGSGMKVSFPSQDSLVLAPRAKMAVSRLSWLSGRAIRLSPYTGAPRFQFEAEAAPEGFEVVDSGVWEEL